MADKSDLLVLGATGFTGKLITRYLSAHPQRSQFKLAIGARSPKKLRELVEALDLPASVGLVQVDVTNDEEVERAVRGTRVVINTVGPYWLWGTPVVRACVRNGVHYVDLTGETAWNKKIILEFDYYATKTGAIIVPSCGFDSIPSDTSAHLANKTLKSLGPASNGQYHDAGVSTTAHHFKSGVSGGTIASVMVGIEQLPKHLRRQSMKPYTLSPFEGERPLPFRFVNKLPIPGATTLIGAFFVMGPGNTALVQRTFGLLELQAKGLEHSCLATRVKHKDEKEVRVQRYGPEFRYNEWQVVPSTMYAIAFTAALVIGFSMLLVKPFRYVAKMYLPKSGEGPSDEKMAKGWFSVTNITTSTSNPAVQVKSVMKGQGDPGYLLTAIMISESALCILLPTVSDSKKKSASNGDASNNVHALSALAQQGGVLTPMTAFGDVLIKRLEETGRFTFSSSVVDGDVKGRKNI
ncbi:Saccharopine dehydrogenase-domain-containing protein [Crassisporium funariophilum]|nr:Saccharopine dehydrogenase-domain-containing protein [Crassisporium funariophilum]